MEEALTPPYPEYVKMEVGRSSLTKTRLEAGKLGSSNGRWEENCLTTSSYLRKKVKYV